MRYNGSRSAGVVLVALGVGAESVSCGGGVHNTLSAEAGGPEASVVVGSDAAACFIEAANYDQSCSLDSDCVSGIQSGNYCQSIDIGCGEETINKKSLTQYMTDVSKTPLGSGAIPQMESSCGLIGGPCCMAGHCTPGNRCSGTLITPVDTGPSGAEDAATVPPGSFMCGLNTGPFDAGADAGGPWRWCMPPESCVPFNGGWACCTVQPSGGASTCVAPSVSDD